MRRIRLAVAYFVMIPLAALAWWLSAPDREEEPVRPETTEEGY